MTFRPLRDVLALSITERYTESHTKSSFHIYVKFVDRLLFH